jgi:uncharacterized repeat protein (TIGR02543 family)
MLAAGVGLGFGAVLAQNAALTEDALVMVGKHKAHPTRILARLADADGEAAAAAVFKATGVAVVNRIGIVPGLVILDDANAGVAGLQKAVAPVNQLLDRMAQLRDSGLFAYVEPDYTVWATATPSDSAFTDGRLWGLRNSGQSGGKVGADISATAAWDLTTGSTNVIVAVIDSGIRYTHQELVSQMWRDPSVTNQAVFGTNAAAGTTDPLDDNGHGTHVAGTIGAAANDERPHVGVAWKVRLMGCKFLTAGGFGQTSDAIGCIDFAVAKGARILNNSWGGGGRLQALEDSIVASRNKGVLFVAAAGNSANNNDINPAFPASYNVDNIISVAALDRRDGLADFSNYGLTSVHVGAPGVEIFSCWTGSDSAYNIIDGTSMASPHVAGVAALIAAKFPQAGLLELRERILLGVDPIPSLTTTTTTGGRVNAHKSLTLAPDGQMEISITPLNNSIILAGSTESLFVKVTDVLSITNATVTVTIGRDAPITLKNDGKAPDVGAGDATYSGNLTIPTNIGPISVTYIVTAPGEANSTNVLTYTVVPRPANDNFVNSGKIGNNGTTTNILVNNRFATMESGEPRHAGAVTAAGSLWWSFSPAVTGKVFVDTSGSSFDTILGVYVGSQVDALTEVASADDVGSRLQGYLTFDAKAGTTYRIAVAGYDDTQFGGVRLRVEPNGSADVSAPIVTVTSPLSGAVVTNKSITLTGTAIDPIPNASGVSDVQVKVNDDPTAIGASLVNGVWTVNSLMQEGANTFQVVAIDFAGNRSSLISLTVNYRVADPLNDLLVNATGLTNNAGSFTGNNQRATKEFSEPLHANNEGGHSVWYKWTAADNGILTLSTTNSAFDTLLAVYTGDKISNLVLVGANDDATDGSGFSKLALTVQSGVTYRIVVDGYGGNSGNLKLTYSFAAAPLYTVALSSSAGGSASATATGLVASNTVVRFSATPEAHYVFAGWEGSIAATNNPLEIKVTNNVTLKANFKGKAFSDDFESDGFASLPWVNSGDAPWTIQSGQAGFGQFSARSGAINNNQRSTLALTAKFKGGASSFQYRVSSEAGWDELVFVVDGAVVSRWSGAVTWSTYSFVLTAGTHTLEWRYEKDFNNSVGEDAAFLDNVDLPIAGPSILVAPASVIAATGETASFTVVASGNSPMSYQWLRNGEALSAGSRFSGVTGSTLAISALTTNDAGAYTVVVTSPGGSQSSIPANLTVIAVPQIKSGPANQTVTAGQMAMFQVEATGLQLSYQWMKGSSPIRGATGEMLHIENATAADAGTYTVRVSNRAGTATASAVLTVNPPAPVITLTATGIGQFIIGCEGTLGRQAQIEGSNDLLTWESIAVMVIDAPTMPFVDINAAERPYRFYRVKLP